MSVARRRVVRLVLLWAVGLASVPGAARAQMDLQYPLPDPNPPARFRAVDLGLPQSDGMWIVALNRRGQIAAVTWSHSADSQTDTYTCWLYDDGRLTNLGSLGGQVCVPLAMNDGGEVVGYATTAEGYNHPFVYSNGRLQDIGLLSGIASGYGYAYAINSAGAVVGESQSATGAGHTFLYDHGVLRDIDPTAVYSIGLAINDAGEIAGVRQLPGGTQTAYRYANGIVEDVGVPGMSIGRLIDANGDIAGSFAIHSGERAFFFTEGGWRDLGTFGGADSYPLAMNASGEVVGYAYTSSGTYHAMVARDGIVRDLGALALPPDDYSYARSINAAGHIVGFAMTGHGPGGFFSTGAGMHDLAALLTPDSPTGITEPLFINDADQIAAMGIVDGWPRAFLLSPVMIATELAVMPAAAQFGGTTVLSALLTSNGSPLVGKVIRFTLGSQTVEAMTGIDGVATASGISLAGFNAGNYPRAIEASFAADTAFGASAAAGALTVTRAPLTVTAHDATKLLGAGNPAFTASYSGLVAGDTPAALGGTLGFATAATLTSPVGTYPITPSGLSSPNYDIRYADGTLTITYNVCVPADQARAARTGSTIPIKLDLCTADGVSSSSRSVVVRATTLRRLPDGASASVQDAGNANPGGIFRHIGRGYIFNLKTSGLSMGTWALVFTVTGDPLEHSVTFQLR